LKYFPDEPSSNGIFTKAIVVAIPLLYLTASLIYSAEMAPWGRQVDPESAYTMNGLVAAAGYGSMKFDHPGTTTTLLVEIIIRSWALVARPQDIVAFAFKNYDAIIYTARTCEALILAGVLLIGGFIVQTATRSCAAAMLFQFGPFVHFDTFHFEMVLIPESLMAATAILSMALTVKVALDRNPPSVRLGVMSGLIFAFGFSSKYLFFPMAAFGVTLLRNRRAYAAAFIAGTIGFVAFNLTLNPGTITRGFGWLFSIASHKGIYGHGEPGFIDFGIFWSNMGGIIAAAPFVSAIFGVAALSSLARLIRTRDYSDPVSVALLAAGFVFLAQLVATSKHFALHYMMTSWVLAGGVLVLTIVQIRRLVPAIPAGALAAVASIICGILISSTLSEARREALEWVALDDAGARLSAVVLEAAPACANVSSMFVRAPENELNHGYDMTMSAWGDQAMKDRFSDSYVHAFKAPLLDQNVYTNRLARNFRAYSYASLAAEYPCIVVRSNVELNDENSTGLLDLKPDHCVIGGIQVYAVGTACANIQHAFSTHVPAPAASASAPGQPR
jgi:hypothetical protein